MINKKRRRRSLPFPAPSIHIRRLVVVSARRTIRVRNTPTKRPLLLRPGITRSSSVLQSAGRLVNPDAVKFGRRGNPNGLENYRVAIFRNVFSADPRDNNEHYYTHAYGRLDIVNYIHRYRRLQRSSVVCRTT